MSETAFPSILYLIMKSKIFYTFVRLCRYSRDLQFRHSVDFGSQHATSKVNEGVALTYWICEFNRSVLQSVLFSAVNLPGESMQLRLHCISVHASIDSNQV
jgi:hypothetical protein